MMIVYQVCCFGWNNGNIEYYIDGGINYSFQDNLFVGN